MVGEVQRKKDFMVREAQKNLMVEKAQKKISWWGKHKKNKKNLTEGKHKKKSHSGGSTKKKSHGGGITKKNQYHGKGSPKKDLMVGEAQKKERKKKKNFQPLSERLTLFTKKDEWKKEKKMNRKGKER